MYGRMLDRRNMLLVDQRGTGRSQPIDCPGLQNPTGPFDYPGRGGTLRDKPRRPGRTSTAPHCLPTTSPR